jgi:hypothetical protein
MSAKHTPGPWSRSNPRSLTIYGPPDRTGWVLTVAHVADRGDKNQALADACLLEAAPDLLAACQAVLDEFPAADGRRIESVKAICRAAITKATAHD